MTYGQPRQEAESVHPAQKSDVIIPLLHAEAMYETNTTVFNRAGHDVRHLTIVNNSGLLFEGAKLTLPEEAQDTADLVADMIALRAISSTSDHRRFLPEETLEIRHERVKKIVQWLNKHLTDADGKPLVSRRTPRGEPAQFGLRDVVVRDLRHTEKQRAPTFMDTVQEIETYITEGTFTHIVLLDAFDMRAARTALQHCAGRLLEGDALHRYKNINTVLANTYDSRTDVYEREHLLLSQTGGSAPEHSTMVFVSPKDQPGWWDRASCSGPQRALFFPPGTFERKDEKLSREARAKEICKTCPVKQPCLDFALAKREPFGIWGGLNENERKGL